jgi:hypothetical protein
VATAQGQLDGLEIQGAEVLETLGPDAGELVEQLRQRFALTLCFVAQAIEGIEGLTLAKFEDLSRARQPVYAVGVGEVADHVEDSPGISAFVAMGPGFGEVAQECVESGGSAGENSD